MKTIKLLSILFIASIVLSACSNDDDGDQEPVNEEEVITTLIATLRPSGGGDTVTFTYRDLEGNGNPNIVVSGALTANTTYNATIQVLNETESPAEDVTLEVLEEDDEHQFLYVIASSLNITITYTDQDGDGNPIGVTFNATTGDASAGDFTIILRHEPNKPNDGTPGDAGGETDISSTFPVQIQ